MMLKPRLLALVPLALMLAACAPAEASPAPDSTQASSTFTPAPDASRAEIMVGCLTDLGWEGLVVEWDGGTDISHIPDEQRDQYTADQEVCMERFPYKPPTDAEIRELYVAEVENSNCLAGLGYQMPEPPSEQTYVDTFGTADQWFAMVGAGPQTMDAATYKDVFTACPPPAWNL